MERIIIIDDKKCEKELAEFLEANKEHIRYSTAVNDIKSTSNSFFEEISSKMGSADKLAIVSNQLIEIVHTRDITYFETLGQKTRIHFSDNRFMETYGTLDSFSNRLKGSTFLRIHENFIVNLDFFSKLNLTEGQTIELSNGIHLPVDQARKVLLVKYLNNDSKQKDGFNKN
jgi:DNA-binding LytR/AlgR family response regulator